MNNLPFVSVVIPTYRREEVLCETIKQVLKQDYPYFEIIIADQLPTHKPEVQAYLKKLSDEGKIRLISLDEIGTTRSKNAAIKIAKGEIILTLDDDVLIPSTKFIYNHVKMYKRKDIAGTAGKVVERKPTKDDVFKNKHVLRNFYGFLYSIITDPTGRRYKDYKINGRFVGKVIPTGAIIVNPDLDGVAYVESFRGGNASFRKKVIMRLGLFDETFRGNAHREENDLALRIIKNGYKIIYTSEAEIFHLKFPRGGSRAHVGLKWYSDFFFNNAFFFYKHFNPVLSPFLLLHLSIEIIKALKAFKLAALGELMRSLKEGYRYGIKAKRAVSQGSR